MKEREIRTPNRSRGHSKKAIPVVPTSDDDDDSRDGGPCI